MIQNGHPVRDCCRANPHFASRKFRRDPPRLACTAALHCAQKSVMEFLATKFNLLREARKISAMATLKPEEEEVLTFDVSDEALEIAGSDKANFTFGICTLDQPGCAPSIDPEPLS